MAQKAKPASKTAKSKSTPFLSVGDNYFIRCLTYHSTGRFVGTQQVGGHTLLLLEDAAWVADSGRFSAAILTGSLSEVEPVDTMAINLANVVDIFPWEHDLPRDVK